MISPMVVLKAHFDGRVLVPDEPLDLAPNQAVKITVEPIETAPVADDTSRRLDYWRSRLGIALDPSDPPQKPHHPDDEDAFWEKGHLPGSIGQRMVRENNGGQ
jgi:hypothetical protein